MATCTEYTKHGDGVRKTNNPAFERRKRGFVDSFLPFFLPSGSLVAPREFLDGVGSGGVWGALFESFLSCSPSSLSHLERLWRVH